MVLGRGSSSSDASTSEEAADKTGATSKRQEKLRKRQERGDPRVKTQTRKQ